MTMEQLLGIYEDTLAWIERRMKPEVLKRNGETPEMWATAKLAAYMMFEKLRDCADGGNPNLEFGKYFDKKEGESLKKDGAEFPMVGILRYRGLELSVYFDDSGQCLFVVCKGREIPLDNMGYSIDWYCTLDDLIDGVTA